MERGDEVQNRKWGGTKQSESTPDARDDYP